MRGISSMAKAELPPDPEPFRGFFGCGKARNMLVGAIIVALLAMAALMIQSCLDDDTVLIIIVLASLTIPLVLLQQEILPTVRREAIYLKEKGLDMQLSTLDTLALLRWYRSLCRSRRESEWVYTTIKWCAVAFGMALAGLLVVCLSY